MKILKLTKMQEFIIFMMKTMVSLIIPTLIMVDDYLNFGFRDVWANVMGKAEGMITWGLIVLPWVIAWLIRGVMLSFFAMEYDRTLDTYTPLKTLAEHVRTMAKEIKQAKKTALDNRITFTEDEVDGIINAYLNSHKDFFQGAYESIKLPKYNNLMNVVTIVKEYVNDPTITI